MPLIIQKEWFTKEQIHKDRNVLFVFGDNLARKGTGGQAKVCRDESNCVGVVTKARPSHNDPLDYLSDDQYNDNCLQIIKDFQPVADHLVNGGTVIYPGDGIGTGLANLKENAPKTLQFIEDYVKILKWLGKKFEAK